MKKIIILAVTVILIFGLFLFGCGHDDKKSEENKVTEKNENKGGVFKEKQENIVFDHFSKGVLVDEPEMNELRFEITSIEQGEEGLEIYYTKHRDDTGYQNYYYIPSMIINGCYFDANKNDFTYWDDEKEVDYMSFGTHVLVKQDRLDRYDISEIDYIQFTFEAGEERTEHTVSTEYEQRFTLFMGGKHDIKEHELDRKDNYIILEDDDVCRLILTDVMWSRHAQKRYIEGQSYAVYFQVHEGHTAEIKFKEVKFDGIVEDLSEHWNSYLYGKEGIAIASGLSWSNLELDYSKISLENARLIYEIKKDDGELEIREVPVNFALDVTEGE